jgi:hypothetical protein
MTLAVGLMAAILVSKSYWQEPYSSLHEQPQIQGGEEGLRASSSMEVLDVT